jgi:hypothetical protein
MKSVNNSGGLSLLSTILDLHCSPWRSVSIFLCFFFFFLSIFCFFNFIFLIDFIVETE